MKKLIILTIISLFVFTNCRLLTSRGRGVSIAEKNFNTGNYYESVESLTKVLVEYPSYEPAIDLLNQSFPLALSNQTKKAEINKSISDLDYAKSAERVLNLYLMISKLQHQTINQLKFSVDYSQKSYWLNETAIAYYNSAENLTTSSKTLKDYQRIASLYGKTYELDPDYKDVSLKYIEFKELGTRHIVYFIPEYNYNYFDFGFLIQSEFMQTLDKDHSFMEFAKLYNGYQLNLSKNYDKLKKDGYNKIVEMDFVKIEYNKPTTKQRYFYENYYEKKFKQDNIDATIIVDSIPNKVEDGVSYTQKSYTRIENEIETSLTVVVKYKIFDLIDGKLLKESFIERSVFDSDKWNTYLWHPTKTNESIGRVKDKYTLLKEIGSELGEELGVEVKRNLY